MRPDHSSRSPAWTIEELTLALGGYFRVKAGADQKLVTTELSNILNRLNIHSASIRSSPFRTVDGVRARLGYFARHDESGAPLRQKNYKTVWQRYSSNPSQLAEEIANILKRQGEQTHTPVTLAVPDVVLKTIKQACNDNIEVLQTVARIIRAGQAKFRNNLLLLYGNCCAISGPCPAAVLEAAHVVFHSHAGINHADNGLLLRADIHLLFDENLVRIHPDTHKVSVGSSLKNTAYEAFDGRVIFPRKDGKPPSSHYLRQRWQTAIARNPDA